MTDKNLSLPFKIDDQFQLQKLLPAPRGASYVSTFVGTEYGSGKKIYAQLLSAPEVVSNPIARSIWNADSNVLADLTRAHEQTGLFLPLICFGVNCNHFYRIYDSCHSSPVELDFTNGESADLWGNISRLLKVKHLLNDCGLFDFEINWEAFFHSDESNSKLRFGCFADNRWEIAEAPAQEKVHDAGMGVLGLDYSQFKLRCLLIERFSFLHSRIYPPEKKSLRNVIDSFFRELKLSPTTDPKWLDIGWLQEQTNKILVLLRTPDTLFFVINTNGVRAYLRFLTGSQNTDLQDSDYTSDPESIIRRSELLKCVNERFTYYLRFKNAVIGLKGYPGYDWKLSIFEAAEKHPMDSNVINSMALSHTNIKVLNVKDIPNNFKDKIRTVTSLSLLLTTEAPALSLSVPHPIFSGFVFLHFALKLLNDLQKWPLLIKKRDIGNTGLIRYTLSIDSLHNNINLMRQFKILRRQSAYDELSTLLKERALEKDRVWVLKAENIRRQEASFFIKVDDKNTTLVFDSDADFDVGQSVELISADGSGYQQTKNEEKLLNALSLR